MKIAHSKSRLEGFSDAVFALAATLMVVSLDSPENIFLLENKLVGILSFGISFMALVLIWLIHYNFFRRIKNIDSIIILWNMILLFVILYFVFPLKTMINSWFGDIGLTPERLGNLFEMYGIGFVVIFICYSAMYYRAFKKSNHVKEKPIELLFYTRHYFIFIVIGIISVILAYSRIGIRFGLPGFIYMLLGPVTYIHSNKFQKKHGKL